MLIRLADDEGVKIAIGEAGPIAFLFVLAMGIAVFIIFRSMNKQMKRISPDLPKGTDDRRQEADARYTEEAVERGEREAAKQGEDDKPGG